MSDNEVIPAGQEADLKVDQEVENISIGGWISDIGESLLGSPEKLAKDIAGVKHKED